MTYELNDPTADHGLTLSGRVCVSPDPASLFDELGLAFTAAAIKADRKRGVFHVALSGGTTPWPFYDALLIDPRFRKICWERTHLWIVDERRVPDDDDLSNFKSLRGSLLEDVSTPEGQVHPMPVLSDDPAGEYEQTLREVFGQDTGVPRMDFVLLGMGGDCHTASLFPNSDAIGVTDRWIVVNDGPNVTPPARVTMTFPLLNAARYLAVLCVGTKKTQAIKRVADQMKTGPDPVNVPITGIQPTDGELTWYLDKDAAGI